MSTDKPQIFNRKNEHMMRKSGQAASISLYPARRKIRFNAAAVEVMGLKAGEFIHFLLFKKKDWCVLVNDDDSGYALTSDSKKREHESLTINSSHFINYILSELKLKPMNCSFYITVTAEYKHNGKEVFLIMTNKTIEQLNKQ